MSADLLRVYESYECGQDGYPHAWHAPSAPYPGGRVFQDATSVTVVPWGSDQLPDGQSFPAIKHYVRELAGHRCLRCGHPYPPGITDTCPRGEWTPCDEHCTHGPPVRVWNEAKLSGQPKAGGNGEPHPGPVTQIREAHWRILTVHHLNEDKADCRWWNLAALCQRCHLRMQRAVVMERVYHYEHSEWFKPFAAGFYAWKYEQADLTRDETLVRMDDLLAYEQRFTQETLL